VKTPPTGGVPALEIRCHTFAADCQVGLGPARTALLDSPHRPGIMEVSTLHDLPGILDPAMET